MRIPNEEDSLMNHPDDVLGPLESYDEYGEYVPHQFVLRKEQNRRHMNYANGHSEVVQICYLTHCGILSLLWAVAHCNLNKNSLFFVFFNNFWKTEFNL